MNFGLRVAIIAAVAVAVSTVGAAAVMYAVVQGQLVRQIDETLIAAAQSSAVLARRQVPPLVTEVFTQTIDRTGRIVRANAEGGEIIVTDSARAVAAGLRGGYFENLDVDGTPFRVYVAPLPAGFAVQAVRSLEEVNAILAQTRVQLTLVALGGVGVAAVLGVGVARGALAPVRQLTSVIDEVARTRNLSRRIAIGGSDELGRLGSRFNEMLEALEASLRAQRQLVADASHELRTPLTSLRTNLELLARGQPTDPTERQQALDDLVDQIERLSRLVADLIDLARDGEIALPIEHVRLDDLVADALPDMRMRYPTIRFVVDSRPSTVAGHRSRLARAITNLLDNAAKWSPPDGIVEVAIAHGEVVVRDHGPGVPGNDVPRIFDRFWRSDGARHLPGSGLGLAIVKEVASAHRGWVTYERAEGGGARFRLRVEGLTSSNS